MGNALKDKGDLDAAIDYYKKGILHIPQDANLHFNLGITLHLKGDTDAAIYSQERANRIDASFKPSQLFYRILNARKKREKTRNISDEVDTSCYDMSLKPRLLVLNRPVENGLLTYLQAKNKLDLSKVENEPSFGNTKGSMYDLFKDDHSAIENVANDVTNILMDTFKSEIFILDSFFSIFGAGGGTVPHTHITSYDKIPGLDLTKQKHSLVYYLSAGDQDCCDPGILKLYEPVDEILPKVGMITIFPSDRPHSSIYGGKTDRVIIGINFYTI